MPDLETVVPEVETAPVPAGETGTAAPVPEAASAPESASEQQGDPIPVLEMSDEEFAKMEKPAYENSEQTVPEQSAGDDVSKDPSGDPPDGGSGESGSPLGDSLEQPQAPAAGGDGKPAERGANGEAEATGTTEPAAEVTPPVKPGTEPDYAAVGREVLAEFKANGHNMQAKSAKDIITLMQMGVNYNQKMLGLKPSLKVLKLLEKNDLLDPDKINYLIDLSQKDPTAITKLLQDSKIDPLTIDMDEKVEYSPKSRGISDTEMQLDDVLESLIDNPHYERTLNVLGKEWDEGSRQVVAQNPEIIRTINEHMTTGIYEQVAKAVMYERSLGKLAGMTDFQAYKQMGDYMNEHKLFVVTPAAAAPGTPSVTPAPANANGSPPEQPAASNVTDEERLRRKAGASPTRKSSNAPKKKDEFDPLAMSDEDFLKLNRIRL